MMFKLKINSKKYILIYNNINNYDWNLETIAFKYSLYFQIYLFSYGLF